MYDFGGINILAVRIAETAMRTGRGGGFITSRRPEEARSPHRTGGTGLFAGQLEDGLPAMARPRSGRLPTRRRGREGGDGVLAQKRQPVHLVGRCGYGRTDRQHSGTVKNPERTMRTISENANTRQGHLAES